METIPVHQRRIIDGRGLESVEEVVDCPRDGRVRLLMACSSCGFACGVGYDAILEGDVVECNEAHAAPKTERGAIIRGTTIEALREVPVGAIAVRDVVCAVPDAPLEAVRRALLEYAIGAVVVVTPARSPVGLVAATDLIAASPGASHARDVMTSSPITVPAELSLARAAAVMAFEGIHHLPVVGPGGRLVGLLSTLDLLRQVGRAAGAIIPDRTARRRWATREES